ncbi:hypothetical protein GRJ2_002639300 [Grus japonensis]|uniref:Uncharacterized protein n=1 Tax=Grus japonensis TaxID=30415 RepID=A0ABC9XWH1_GRUJA
MRFGARARSGGAGNGGVWRIAAARLSGWIRATRSDRATDRAEFKPRDRIVARIGFTAWTSAGRGTRTRCLASPCPRLPKASAKVRTPQNTFAVVVVMVVVMVVVVIMVMVVVGVLVVMMVIVVVVMVVVCRGGVG